MQNISPPSLGVLSERLLSQLRSEFPEVGIDNLTLERVGEFESIRLQLITTTPSMELWNSLGKIARQSDALLPIFEIQINSLTPIKVNDVKTILPDLWQEMESPQKISNLIAYSQVVTRLALQTRTIVEVSKGGIYLSMLIRNGGTPPGNPPVSPHEIHGKTIREVCGQRAQDKILEVINKSIDSGSSIHFSYSAQFRGESYSRIFVAECHPKPSCDGAWLVISRLPEVSRGVSESIDNVK